ncbi:DUF2218 domain-containing protein [Sabulicella rubraurantiaca]|uniref:DUF2218 domain-containing protein n=1 Tax=Sabulicella rubraurantiaca TaxID=2811429 RepID=UPI001A9787FB|nr:DUF2218 domain-containing protein [Sabulicella rubraurantiaca]
MNTAQALVPTATPGRYLQQLCKHFAHKRPVTFDEQRGQIGFTIGDCRLEAGAGVLKLSVTAPDAAQLAQLQDVVARHLVRFALREPVVVEWREG